MPHTSYFYEEDKLTTVQYESTFLLFDSTSTIFYKYDSAEEDFLPMPVKMSKPMGGGSPILVSLDNFPTTTTSTVGSGKILFLGKRRIPPIDFPLVHSCIQCHVMKNYTS